MPFITRVPDPMEYTGYVDPYLADRLRARAAVAEATRVQRKALHGVNDAYNREVAAASYDADDEGGEYFLRIHAELTEAQIDTSMALLASDLGISFLPLKPPVVDASVLRNCSSHSGKAIND